MGRPSARDKKGRKGSGAPYFSKRNKKRKKKRKRRTELPQNCDQTNKGIAKKQFEHCGAENQVSKGTGKEAAYHERRPTNKGTRAPAKVICPRRQTEGGGSVIYVVNQKRKREKEQKNCQLRTREGN